MSLFQAIKRTVRPMPRGHLWHPCIETQLNFNILCRDYWRNNPKYKNSEKKVAIRIPHPDGHFDDTPYFPDWDKLIGIGVSGWDWADQVSRFFFIDLDASDHAAGLSSDRLSTLITRLRTIPWIEIRHSKGGIGYQLLVTLKEPLRAYNHDEHARYAKRVAEHLGITDDTDATGVIGWIWHRDAKAHAWDLIT